MYRLPKTMYSSTPKIFPRSTLRSPSMRPTVEIYPLFFAIGAGLAVSFAAVYSTFTRSGSDVLVDKGNKRYYWDKKPVADHISRNPLNLTNRRT